MIQRSLWLERVVLLAMVFFFPIAFHEVRHRIFFRWLAEKIRQVRPDLSFKMMVKIINNFNIIGRNGAVVLVAALILAGVSMLLAGTDYYLVMMALLVPVLVFSPLPGTRYLSLIAGGIALYLAWLVEMENVFNLFFIMFLYRCLLNNRLGGFEAISPVAFLLIFYLLTGTAPFLNLLLLGATAGLIHKPRFAPYIKAFLIVHIGLALISEIWSDSNLVDAYFNKLLAPFLVLNFMIFFFPARKAIILAGFAGAIALLVALHRPLETAQQSFRVRESVRQNVLNIQSSANKLLESTRRNIFITVEPAIENIGYRPIDYVESVTISGSSLGEKIGTGMANIGEYARLTLVPYPMSFYYGYRCVEKTSLSDPLALAILISVAVLLFFAFFFSDKNKLASAGVLIYFLSLIPVANIIVPVSGMMADRYLFIPSLGFCLLIVLLLFRVFKLPVNRQTPITAIPKGFKISFCAILLLYSWLTIARNFQWKDDLTLMRHDIKHLACSAQAYNLLATHLAQRAINLPQPSARKALLEEAEDYYQASVAIYPDFFNVWYDLGRVRMMMEKYNEAEEPMRKVLALDSTFSQPLFNLGLIKHHQGEIRDAISYYSQYLKKILMISMR